MIDSKKVVFRILSKQDESLQDITIGKVYEGTTHREGTHDISGVISLFDTISFYDDENELVCAWRHDADWEFIEGDFNFDNPYKEFHDAVVHLGEVVRKTFNIK